ncbi:Aldo/keto reductase [Terfezia boudieri ATCC MYA-4762]|uniref:Aldo/keto reductase n=1 Tax=Terfezia boudieri ATCC MYA-4762 TaxID=1051890 RepID=A0A3N4LV13_9PEZI|nr:Aldo/keto reductase [Terfezia boudieri ATCC MYA-4762]
MSGWTALPSSGFSVVKTFTLNTGATIPSLALEPGNLVLETSPNPLNTPFVPDTAHIDGVGLGIRNSGVPPSKIFVTTKLDNAWHKRVEEGVTNSLHDLGLDYVDLYLIHWPSSNNSEKSNEVYGDWDYVNTWAEMQKLPAPGRVKAIGVLNFGITHLERLLDAPSTKIFPALVEYCNSKGIHCSTYSPLGRSEKSPAEKNKAVVELSRRYGKSNGWSVLVRWSLKEEDVKGLEMEVKERSKNCGDECLPHRVFFGG